MGQMIYTLSRFSGSSISADNLVCIEGVQYQQTILFTLREFNISRQSGLHRGSSISGDNLVYIECWRSVQ